MNLLAKTWFVRTDRPSQVGVLFVFCGDFQILGLLLYRPFMPLLGSETLVICTGIARGSLVYRIGERYCKFGVSILLFELNIQVRYEIYWFWYSLVKVRFLLCYHWIIFWKFINIANKLSILPALYVIFISCMLESMNGIWKPNKHQQTLLINKTRKPEKIGATVMSPNWRYGNLIKLFN